MSGRILALTGAESTGKTTLARELARVLAGRGLDAVMVPEALRDFCDQHGRTPTAAEQAAIAAEQTRRIQEAAIRHALVLADTTALMTAVYSELIFQDLSLYEQAERDHAQVSMTLLMSLDLVWTPDGLQRDGPHVREPVDTLIRASLARMQHPYAVVAGQGIARIQHGLSAIEHLLDTPQRQQRAALSPRWRWFCENCDDGDCEQHWLAGGR
ncbi:MAG: ATP-binding protein [Burkholderiales bacterium]|nr:ATP-binding protein [Burkholderiales bacterium]